MRHLCLNTLFENFLKKPNITIISMINPFLTTLFSISFLLYQFYGIGGPCAKPSNFCFKSPTMVTIRGSDQSLSCP